MFGSTVLGQIGQNLANHRSELETVARETRGQRHVFVLGVQIDDEVPIGRERVDARLRPADGTNENELLRLAASDPAGAGAHLDLLLRGLLRRQPGPWVFPRALPSEPAVEALERYGFRPAARVLRMAAVAQPA